MRFYLCVVFVKLIVLCSALTPHVIENDPRPHCECGSERLLSTRVVGGHDAARGQFHFASALMYNYGISRSDYHGRPYCGGTLITDRHIVTAAHCLRDRSPSTIEVDVDDYNINYNASEIRDKKLFRNAAKFTTHSGYHPPSFNNDVAIVEMKKPVQFNNRVKTAWLTFPESNLSPGDTVTVYGWGRLEYSGESPDILQTLDLPVVDHKHCQMHFQSEITKNMICAGGKENEDACIGDSGSGLTKKIEDDYVLVGIVSFGKKCAMKDVPGIYTKLSNYVDWIYNQTRNAACQPCIVSAKDLSK